MSGVVSAIGVSCSRRCCRAARACKALIAIRFGSKRLPHVPAAHGLADRFSYQVAVAEKLPFADASFDLVTCQTVLIHTPDPGAAVDEMVRVARPGGLILAAEPNNVASALIFDSLSFHDPVDEIIARVRLQLICERGKAALGEGNNSIGDLVPGLFAERGLVNVRVYLNDKANALPAALRQPRAARHARRARRLQASRFLDLEPRGHAPVFPCGRWSRR